MIEPFKIQEKVKWYQPWAMRKFRIISNTFLNPKSPSRLSRNSIYVISDINLANCRLTRFKFKLHFLSCGRVSYGRVAGASRGFETWKIKCNGFMNIMQRRSESHSAYSYVYVFVCPCILIIYLREDAHWRALPHCRFDAPKSL